MAIRPRASAPALRVDQLNGGYFDVRTVHPRAFTFLVFYRGVHCGFCRRYLQDLEANMDEFTKRGVEVLALSCDTKERAQRSRDEWGIKKLPLAYGLSLESARNWGLFISTGIKDDQPDLFSEPGLFLIQPDGTLYAAYIQTLPFARPRIADILHAIDFVTERGKPARGEVVDITSPAYQK